MPYPSFFIALLATTALLVDSAQAGEPSAADYERALAILESAPVFDGHNDLPWYIRDVFQARLENFDFRDEPSTDTDIRRLRQGGVGAQFWSVFVPSALAPLEAMTAQLEQIDLTRRLIAAYPDDLLFATSTADIATALETGRIASLLGMEGGHTIGNSLGVLRSYYNLGVRYMTLTHSQSHDWAGAASNDPDTPGLTDFGRDVIREMNRLGMIVDLSHASDATMRDAISVSSAPVIFSHSSARTLVGHARNVPDDVLALLKENGGIVMVTFIPSFVSESRREWGAGAADLIKTAKSKADMDRIGATLRKLHGPPPMATIEQVADHIDYVARTIGHEHVGIGSDFYGQTGDDLVQGLEDVAAFPALIAELLSRGWTDQQIKSLTFSNMLRVFSEVEATARRGQTGTSD